MAGTAVARIVASIGDERDAEHHRDQHRPALGAQTYCASVNAFGSHSRSQRARWRDGFPTRTIHYSSSPLPVSRFGLDQVHHGRVGQRGDVAELAVLGDVAQAGGA